MTDDLPCPLPVYLLLGPQEGRVPSRRLEERLAVDSWHFWHTQQGIQSGGGVGHKCVHRGSYGQKWPSCRLLGVSYE